MQDPRLYKSVPRTHETVSCIESLGMNLGMEGHLIQRQPARLCQEGVQHVAPYTPPPEFRQHTHAPDTSVRKQSARSHWHPIRVFCQHVERDRVPIIALQFHGHALLAHKDLLANAQQHIGL